MHSQNEALAKSLAIAIVIIIVVTSVGICFVFDKKRIKQHGFSLKHNRLRAVNHFTRISTLGCNRGEESELDNVAVFLRL